MAQSKYPEELAAIRALRDAFPNEGPKKLANRIKEGVAAFTDAAHQNFVCDVGQRTLLSTYSVIRRHDANKKVLGAKLAKTVKKGLAAV